MSLTTHLKNRSSSRGFCVLPANIQLVAMKMLKNWFFKLCYNQKRKIILSFLNNIDMDKRKSQGKFSRPGDKERQNENLASKEIEEALISGRIIEFYEDPEQVRKEGVGEVPRYVIRHQESLDGPVRPPERNAGPFIFRNAIAERANKHMKVHKKH